MGSLLETPDESIAGPRASQVKKFGNFSRSVMVFTLKVRDAARLLQRLVTTSRARVRLRRGRYFAGAGAAGVAGAGATGGGAAPEPSPSTVRRVSELGR
jgi:hypothetical protein